VFSLKLLKRVPITRIRRDVGSYTGNRYTPAAEVETVIKVSLQNHETDGASSMQEPITGDWTRDWKQVFCELGALREGDEKVGLPADKFRTSNGNVYEVKRANTWDTGMRLNHTEAFAVRVA